MGRQVQFFAIDDDYRALLTAATQAGLVAVPAEIATGSKPTRSAPSSFTPPAGARLFYLAPKDVPDDALVFAPSPSDPSRATLRFLVSPVIELRPCRRDGSVLHDGRVHLDGGSKQPKLDALSKGYDKIARVMRGWAQSDQFNFKIGPQTVDAVKRGALSLKHLRYDLNVADPD